MTPRGLLRFIGLFAVLGALLGMSANVYFGGRTASFCVTSNWLQGNRVSRGVAAACAPLPASAVAQASTESVLAIAPLPPRMGAWRGVLLVPERDGLQVEFRGRSAMLTPSDLLRHQLYETSGAAEIGLGIGAAWAPALALLAGELGTTVDALEREGSFSRVRFARQSAPATAAPTRADFANAAHASAVFLARNVDDAGNYRYLIDGPTNTTLEGYSWARHAGSTILLADAYRSKPDEEIGRALRLTTQRLAALAAVACGKHTCINSVDEYTIAVTALAMIAFAHSNAALPNLQLAALNEKFADFLRSTQRVDGEFMHDIDAQTGQLADVQIPYVSGQISLALALHYASSRNPADLDAARRGLAYQTRHAWSFFGSRYFAAEEHWTCQALGAVWDSAPDETALDFCLNWHRVQRAMQYQRSETLWDAEGAFGVGPLFSPKTTPSASRLEAATAVLRVLRVARPNSSEIPALELECAQAAAYLLRQQWLPGPRYLLVNPGIVLGAMPGSPTDFHLRNDYAQHAGLGMLQWSQLMNEVR